MHIRLVCVLAVSLAGSATNPTQVADDEAIFDVLQKQNQGIVRLVHRPMTAPSQAGWPGTNPAAPPAH
jgi:hypothetical protein